MQAVKVEIHPGVVPDSAFHDGLEMLKKDAVAGFEWVGEIQPLVAMFTDVSTDIMVWADGGIPYEFIEKFYKGARGYIAAFESWYVEAKTADAEKIGRPSQHPDRKEALMVIGESRDGWWEMASWDIIRNGAGVHLVRSIQHPDKTESQLAAVLWGKEE